MTTTDLDRIRGEALARVDRARKVFWIAFWAAGGVELMLLLGYVSMMDFGDRLHLLLLMASILVYWTLGMCVVALGAWVNLMTQKVLRSIDLIGS